jgi:hypothetical protein
MAGTAVDVVRQTRPQHPVFRIAPIAAPVVVVFVESNFHLVNPPCFFSDYLIIITIVCQPVNVLEKIESGENHKHVMVLQHNRNKSMLQDGKSSYICYT